MPAEEIAELLIQFKDVLEYSRPIAHFGREIGWFIIKWMVTLVSGLEGVLNDVYKLYGFFETAGVQKFMREWTVVTYAIGAVSLMIFFIRYMKNDYTPMKKVFDNLLLAIGTVVMMSLILSTATNLTFDAAKSISNDKSSRAYAILKENVVDVLVYDEKGWDSINNIKEKNNIPESNLDFLDMTETLKANSELLKSPTSKEMFSKKIQLNAAGEAVAVKMNKGMWKWDEEYFRYKWHPMQIFFTLLIYGLVLFFTTFKLVKLIYELGYNRVIATFFAFGDLLEAQKVKKIITNTMNILVTVLMIALNMRLYFLFVDVLYNWNFGAVSTLVIHLAIGMAVIDGPFIVQELTGIDAGLKSVGQNLAGMYAAAKGVSALGNGVGAIPNKVKEGAEKIKNAAATVGSNGLQLMAGAAGVADGLIEGLAPGESSLEMDKLKAEDPDDFSSIEDDMGKQLSSKGNEHAPDNQLGEPINGLDTAASQQVNGEANGIEELNMDKNAVQSNHEDLSSLEEPSTQSSHDDLSSQSEEARLAKSEKDDFQRETEDTEFNQTQERLQADLAQSGPPEPKPFLSDSEQALSGKGAESTNIPNLQEFNPTGVNVPDSIKNNPGKQDLNQAIANSAITPQNQTTLKNVVDNKIGEIGANYSEKVANSPTITKSNRNYEVARNTTAVAITKGKNLFKKK